MMKTRMPLLFTAALSLCGLGTLLLSTLLIGALLLGTGSTPAWALDGQPQFEAQNRGRDRTPSLVT
ncbi:MAG: hypothetical protein ACI82H_000787, partial [Alphaproteobacteria bacterium]